MREVYDTGFRSGEDDRSLARSAVDEVQYVLVHELPRPFIVNSSH